MRFFLPLILLCASASAADDVLVAVQQDHLWIIDPSNPSVRHIVASGEPRWPRLSTSRAWIAFIDHQHLIVTSAASSETFQPFSAEPIEDPAVWSPTADVAAVTRHNNVYLISQSNGWSPEKVFEGGKDNFPYGAMFTPDGKQLAITIRTEQGGNLQMLNLADRKLSRPHFKLPYDGMFLDQWAPDSKSLLFWRDPGFSAADGLPLFSASLADGNVRDLGVQTLLYHGFVEFSPDAKFLAFAEVNDRMMWTNKRISVLDFTTGTKTFITDEHTAALFPAWSPDGSLLAYSAGPESGGPDSKEPMRMGPDAQLGEVRLWISKPDGSSARKLTSDPAYRDERPHWSSDGASIIFCRVNAAGIGSIWRIAATGGQPQQIAGPFSLNDEMFGFYGYTDWSQAVDVSSK